eukprot:179588-Alexandrium_andersonii.AAC.1
MLAVDNKRKAYCWYLQWLDTPSPLLCHEDLWLTVGVLRTSIVKQVKGGLSGVVKHWLHYQYAGEQNLSIGQP